MCLCEILKGEIQKQNSSWWRGTLIIAILFLLVAFSPCRGTNKHQWRWRKSLWTRHYVGGNFLSNWVILKEKDLACQEVYWRTTKKKFLWSLLSIYKSWYERFLMMHYLEEVLETLKKFFLLKWKSMTNSAQYSSKIRKTTSTSTEGKSVALLLLIDKLEITLFISSRTTQALDSAECR